MAAAMLVLWGTIVALDLVSFPQSMVSRPLVAATVAGAITGDLAAGLRIGILLELFALDVLPVGASRYPDFGPAAVAGTAIASQHGIWELLLGPAVGTALVVALVGGRTLQSLRARISRAVHAAEPELAAGDMHAVRRLMRHALLADAARGAALTAAGLVVAAVLARWPLPAPTAAMMSLIAVAGAGAAASGGALRSAGRGGRMRWLLVGACAGMAVVVLR